MLSGCKISRPSEVDEVPPAVVGQPDQGVVAAWAANDGAQFPHLVDHSSSEPIGPPASIASVLRGGHFEGEDLPECACRSVAVQPKFVHANLPSLRSVRSSLARRCAPGPPAQPPPPPQAVWARTRRREGSHPGATPPPRASRRRCTCGSRSNPPVSSGLGCGSLPASRHV